MRNCIALVMFAATSVVTGCGKTVEPETVPVRGLKTILIEEAQNLSVRRYPSVLQPVDTSTLSFEIPGRLNSLGLEYR